MISIEYLMSLMTWVAIVGGAVVVELLVVPQCSRRRAVYSTLLFTIPLAITGFLDGVSRQLQIVECSGVIVALSVLIVILAGARDFWHLSRTDSAVTSDRKST